MRQSLVIKLEDYLYLDEAVVESTYRKQDPQPMSFKNKEFVMRYDFKAKTSLQLVRDASKSFKVCAKRGDKIKSAASTQKPLQTL